MQAALAAVMIPGEKGSWRKARGLALCGEVRAPREGLGEAIEDGEAQLQRILQLTEDERSVGWLPMTVAGVERSGAY